MAAMNNAGSIRKNDRKEEPNHPDYRGSVTVDGVAYWVSGWVKKGDDGPWLSLAFRAKEVAQDNAPKREPQRRDEEDEILPF